jgi:hypothetical protein
LWGEAPLAKSPCLDEVGDAEGGLVRVLVFPDPRHGPAGVMQAFVGVGVPGAVSGDLGRPVPAINVVPSLAMLLAAVPEAAIHEHRHPLGGEHDVGDAGKPRKRASVDPVAQAATVKR